MLDLHCHILPGIDHGAQNLNQARQMLAAAKEQGITRIVATPHVYSADFDRSKARHACETLRPYAQQMNIELVLGYEFNISALDYEHLERASAFCIDGTNTLLLEMPFDLWPPHWKHIFYDLQARGMEIILAHPERYRAVQSNLQILEKLAQMDVMFQVDVPQSLRRFSKQNKVLRTLIDMDRLHYAASDAHQASDYGQFARSIQKLSKHLQIME